MAEHDFQRKEVRPAGYEALVRRYDLDVIPNWHRSFVADSGTHRIHQNSEMVEEIFSPPYWPGDSLGDQLEFALKYDGTNLGILARLFQVVPEEELLAYVSSRLTGKYARRLWFLYELLTGLTLPLNDLTRGNYVDLLDPDYYYTITPAPAVRRQRINNNLLGDSKFCPIVRRTEVLRRFEEADLTGRCKQIVEAYPQELLKRAMSYLYTKETKSSFEIEHIDPNSTRTERFIALLHLAEKKDFCETSALIDLQNRIVDARFQASGYRTDQNYVGETVSFQQERIHFVGPKPDDLNALMEGLIAAHLRMQAGGVHAVVHAAAAAYGFVFLHPFPDGNGRIHRFLIHNVLARRGFTPEDLIFPVSAAMLREAVEYDESLEAFSRPLMRLVQYSLDEDGRLTVHNDTAKWYAFIDMTPQAEALFRFIEYTIDRDLAQELSFLLKYDKTKSAIQEIVDMPDRQIDLLIRFCLQNKGTLSATKRASHFSSLSDEEVARIEQAIHTAYHETSTDLTDQIG